MFIFIKLLLVLTCINCRLTMFGGIKIGDKSLYPLGLNVTAEEARYLANVKYPWEHGFKWEGIISISEVISSILKSALTDMPFGAYNKI